MIKLSPRHKQIVILVGRDGLNYRQIGEALGISKDTVVSHVRAICLRADSPKPPRTLLAHLYHKLPAITRIESTIELG